MVSSMARGVVMVHKPTRVQMVQWTGGNHLDVEAFAGHAVRFPGDGCEVYDRLHVTWIMVLPGQWIVRGVMGEYYPLHDEARTRSYHRELKPSLTVRTIFTHLGFFLLGAAVMDNLNSPIRALILSIIAAGLFVIGLVPAVKEWLREDG